MYVCMYVCTDVLFLSFFLVVLASFMYMYVCMGALVIFHHHQSSWFTSSLLSAARAPFVHPSNLHPSIYPILFLRFPAHINSHCPPPPVSAPPVIPAAEGKDTTIVSGHQRSSTFCVAALYLTSKTSRGRHGFMFSTMADSSAYICIHVCIYVCVDSKRIDSVSRRRKRTRKELGVSEIVS